MVQVNSHNTLENSQLPSNKAHITGGQVIQLEIPSKYSNIKVGLCMRIAPFMKLVIVIESKLPPFRILSSFL